MGFDMNNMAGMLKKMQDEMARIQAELETAEIEGSDPSGKVRVKVNGQREPLEVKIDPSAIDPDDLGLLEDLTLFAIRDAMKKAEQHSAEKLGSLTRGLPPIPGFQPPFGM